MSLAEPWWHNRVWHQPGSLFWFWLLMTTLKELEKIWLIFIFCNNIIDLCEAEFWHFIISLRSQDIKTFRCCLLGEYLGKKGKCCERPKFKYIQDWLLVFNLLKTVQMNSLFQRFVKFFNMVNNLNNLNNFNIKMFLKHNIVFEQNKSVWFSWTVFWFLVPPNFCLCRLIFNMLPKKQSNILCRN